MAKPAKPIIVHRAQLADLLGVTPDSVTRYIAQGMPVLSTGSGRGRRTTLDLREALHWWMRVEGDARERLLTLQGDRMVFDLAVKRGEFIAVDEAKRDGANVSRAVCMKLRRVPSAHAHQAAMQPAATVQQIFAKAIDDALRELAALAEQQVEEEQSA